ncbi:MULTISPECIES: ABC transporter substrate-binding protein [Mycolicibacterium]|uniref:Extracellular solute-binding protein n=1 Tax=Mycolicibacterium chitae TaxID=1792 RepID=A0A3S4V7K7_MYCCI|nr:ABC transporter substrate-binding protein [Mycolicibacterium chitae]VEG45584.1 extracellular solute-binding protein [Mycolicibacterium chitae]
MTPTVRMRDDAAMGHRWAATQSVLGVAVGMALATLSGCAIPSGQPQAAPSCEHQDLATLYPEIFTFGTDQPAYPPWYIGDNPANGEGFESAVAYAVAERLGYGPEQVRWVRIPFNTAMAPGAKPFDADLSQFSITDQRREIVDFSAPYYDVTQAVVALRGSPAAAATSQDDLRPLRIGAQVGTTSSGAARSVGALEPVAVYNTNVEAKRALAEGQIDALVLDLPTAITIQAELADSLIVGQLPTSGEPVEQLGMVLDKDSRLTGCVSQAVEALRDDGVLDELERRWLSDGTRPRTLS